MMKKRIALLLALVLGLSVCGSALAVQEDVEGEIVIYSSMYQFVLDMLDEAIRAEFPNLKPGNGGSFFVYGGSSSLIVDIHDQMLEGALGCDLLLVAEPSLSLELKEAGWLEPVMLETAGERLRFPYDEDGCWYPVRVCNMVLAYNPEREADFAAKGVTIPRTFKKFAADRSLKGLISMGNPLTSGTAFAAVASLTQFDHYGRQFLRNLATNLVVTESSSQAFDKLASGECAAVMVLEEAVLKVLKDAEDAGTPRTDLACIYPEDGVILIPSAMMTVAEEHSKNKNVAACRALEEWLLSDEAQEIILKGFMHSPLKGMNPPWNSVDTDTLIGRDMGVNWENVYKHREEINIAWTGITIHGLSFGR